MNARPARGPVASALAAAVFVTVLAAAPGCRTTPKFAPDSPLGRDAHPRLLFRAADVERMKRTLETVPEAMAQWEQMLARADPAREIELPVPGTPIQPDWARVTGRMGGHAAQCGVVYQMTGRKPCADWVRRMLLEWARAFDERVDFRLCGDWHGTEVGHKGEGGNNMAFFFAGELLTRAALAYDCIHDTLSDEDRETIERDFFGRFVETIESVDYSRRMPGKARDFMTGGGQWNGANLCNMGLAAVGFALGDERLLERGVRNFKLYLARDLLSDGFWIEEDRTYSDLCMRTLFTLAWMARSCGYTEDLFNLVAEARPPGAYDRRYGGAPPECDGPAPPERSLVMYLDAQIGYQYPTLGPGNWGWYPGRGSITDSGQLIGLYTAGYAVWGKDDYAFVLGSVDRGRARLGLGGLGLLYFARPIEAAEPPDARSRWYPHARWVVLKSVEGRAYWGSDALVAFVPYGTHRPKGLQPLSLDLSGFGRVVAPRTAITDYAQNLTKPYQLNEPAWNTVMVDGCNISTFRDRADREWLAYHDFGPLVKVAAPRLHLVGQRKRELHTANVERHPEEDRTMGRSLALTDAYLVDAFHIAYDRPPKYKHNFDYVLHGAGTLAFDRAGRSSGRFDDQTAVWTQDGAPGAATVGLRSTILSAMPRGGTKLKKFTDARGDFLVATRGGYEEWFVVVHEPFRGEPRIDAVRLLADEPDAVLVEVRMIDGTVDLVALRTRPSKKVYRWDVIDGMTLELEGDYLFVRKHPDGRLQVQRRKK